VLVVAAVVKLEQVVLVVEALVVFTKAQAQVQALLTLVQAVVVVVAQAKAQERVVQVSLLFRIPDLHSLVVAILHPLVDKRFIHLPLQVVCILYRLPLMCLLI
jgi:hypothetical protein